jgi:hypothetical protein
MMVMAMAITRPLISHSTTRMLGMMTDLDVSAWYSICEIYQLAPFIALYKAFCDCVSVNAKDGHPHFKHIQRKQCVWDYSVTTVNHASWMFR